MFHGDSKHCQFCGGLVEMLRNRKLEIYGHSHPGEEIPTPSIEDRKTLRELGQYKSKLISGLSGLEIEYTADPFEI